MPDHVLDGLALAEQLLALGKQPDDLFGRVVTSLQAVVPSIPPSWGVGPAQRVDQLRGIRSLLVDAYGRVAGTRPPRASTRRARLTARQKETPTSETSDRTAADKQHCPRSQKRGCHDKSCSRNELKDPISSRRLVGKLV